MYIVGNILVILIIIVSIFIIAFNVIVIMAFTVHHYISGYTVEFLGGYNPPTGCMQ